MSTREDPDRNSLIMTSRVFWSMSPWVADTVWSRLRILSVSQSTLRRVLMKITDCPQPQTSVTPSVRKPGPPLEARHSWALPRANRPLATPFALHEQKLGMIQAHVQLTGAQERRKVQAGHTWVMARVS